MLVKRSLILDKQEDYALAFAVVTERLYRSSYLDKVKVSFSGLLFEDSGIYTCEDDGCRKQNIFQLSNRVHSLEAEI